MFIHRARAAIAVLLLLGSTMFTTAPTSAHTGTPLHFYQSCSTDTTSTEAEPYHWQAHVVRNGSYKNVRSTVDIVSLHACSTSSTRSGWSMINAANFTTNGGSGQIGYAMEACGPQGCQNGFPSQTLEFWWTPSDQSIVIYPATWIDFNSDGTHDRPLIGERFTFSIERLTTSNYWQYCVVVVTSARYSAGTSDCNIVSRNTTNYMTKIWWGAEIYNGAGALGALDSGDDTDLTPMQYINSTGSLWSTVTSATCEWTVTPRSSPTPTGSQKSA